MPRPATPRDLSLKWLELFQICARKGSLQAAALETGLTVSTVSHHLRSLEDHLGVALFNHSRRPMVLTPKGQAFLRNIEGALQSIRKAKAEATAGNARDASHLRIGVIEDFDSDISPDLAVFLSNLMPRCDFLFQTDTSAGIVERLRDRQLDLGVTAGPTDRLGDLQDRPLLRDPFVAVLPADTSVDPDMLLHPEAPLPFLRFASSLIIARQIEAQLRRTGNVPARRFECSNHQTLMALVAAGAGWAITTPLLFARAKRFHDRLRMCPFPGKSFSRRLYLVSTPDCAGSVVDLVNGQLRQLISDHALTPFHQSASWLRGEFALIDQ